MNKPRLLILLNRLSIGGPAVNTLSAAAVLSNDFDILLVAGEPMQDEQPADFLLEQYKGFSVKKITSMQRSILPGKDIRSYYQIKQIIREFKPDIVHTHGAKPGVLGRIAAWRSGVPVIIHTFHGHVFHSYFNSTISNLIIRAEQMLANISTVIIAINQKLKEELLNEYKITAASKIKLVRLGVETEKFSDPGFIKRKQFRIEFSLANETTAVGIVGRLVPVKQHRLFIEVAEQLIQLLKEKKELKFFIVGDGAEKEKLVQLLQQKGISFSDNNAIKNNAQLIFTSWRNDMDLLYAGLDIVMLTSLNEGTPVSIMEAMAAGKPVVSTNAGGIAELIEHGQTGFIGNHVQDLTASVMQLVQNPMLQTDLGNNARSFALKHFSKKTETEQLMNLYHLLLRNHKERVA